MKYEYWGVNLADSKLASNHTNHIKKYATSKSPKLS